MRETKNSMRVVSFGLPANLDLALTALARQRQVSRSVLVREALENHLKPAHRSALDLAGNLVGSIDGPAGLSASSKRMKGFGR